MQRLARSFATVVESGGFKVAAFDTNQPTSSVTFLVKAGSRFESKPGAAHGLKNFAFKVCLLYIIVRFFSHNVAFGRAPRNDLL